jgi:predicted SAM-dependent methyltransferase
VSGSADEIGTATAPLAILNLGCGSKTSDHPGVTNIDWSYYLKLGRSRFGRRMGEALLRGERLERLKSIPDNILVHDLAKGIPADDRSVDVVYHSHMLEHLDRSAVPHFLREAFRVLKPGGVHRIVVPDLERLVKEYLESLRLCTQTGSPSGHDKFVEALFEQSVRKASAGQRDGQRRVVRLAERVLVGDARRRGETHQWMYDRVNLAGLLQETGYVGVTSQRFNTSRIDDWPRYGLDQRSNGGEYKVGSLYIEALRPK